MLAVLSPMLHGCRAGLRCANTATCSRRTVAMHGGGGGEAAAAAAARGDRKCQAIRPAACGVLHCPRGQFVQLCNAVFVPPLRTSGRRSISGGGDGHGRRVPARFRHSPLESPDGDRSRLAVGYGRKETQAFSRGLMRRTHALTHTHTRESPDLMAFRPRNRTGRVWWRSRTFRRRRETLERSPLRFE
jgi:hypothetical protein